LTDTATYGYDTNGSLTTRSTTSGDSSTQTWNLRNLLASASVTAGGTTNTTAYGYDDSGIQVRRAENGTTRFLQTDGMNPTGYVQVIEELTPGGALLASFVHGMEPVSQSQGGTITHFLMDGHSGVRLLLSAAALILNTYRFDAYGVTLGQAGTAVNPLLYRGEKFDPVLGQYYLRARFYHPASGRFTRLDPVASTLTRVATLHTYLYCGADPIHSTDPSGGSLLNGLMARITVQLFLFVTKHPFLAGAIGFAINLFLPQEFHEAMVGSGIPPFQFAGRAGTSGRGLLRTIFAGKSPWFTRFVQRWNQSASGTLHKGLGEAFERFVARHMPDAARQVPVNPGVSKHTVDFVWRGFAIEVKAAKDIDADQLRAVANYAKQNDLTLVYYFLEEPPRSVINSIHDAGGHIVYLTVR
jgi:RHS repeat-associated protein